MKKRYFLFLTFFLYACISNMVPADFSYKEIKTNTFTLYSYQKISRPNEPVKIYIEGDGFAFNFHGRPSNDPTPKSDFVKRIAFSDKNPNVAYLARPCQYILNKNPICSNRHWTTARFAPEVVRSTAEAIKQIAKNNEVILIGYSGGAQIAGLVAVLNPDIKVKKIITVAGNLDHLAWTQYHNLPSLSESLNLESYHRSFADFPQIHYVGKKDKNITYKLVYDFVKNKSLIIEVNEASHNFGWEKAISMIIDEH